MPRKDSNPARWILPSLVAFFVFLSSCEKSRKSRKIPPYSSAEISDSAVVPEHVEALGRAASGTHTEMRGMAMRIMDGVTMRIAYLSGTATPQRPGTPVVLDDPTSYRLHIDRAESRVGYEDLARLMNDHVFAYKGAPIGSLHLEREHDKGEEVRLDLKGHLKSLAGVPFEIEGVPEVTPDGRVRVRTRSIQSIGIKMGGLMKLLGIKTEDIADFKKARGIEVDGNDMILDPSRMLPPPESSGKVTHVALEPDAMVMRFGNGNAPEKTGEGYLSYRGGTIRLGRMTMTDADLTIFDADPSDPFDFYPNQMNKQISAGYVKVKEDGGLKIYAPDFAEIDQGVDLPLKPRPETAKR